MAKVNRPAIIDGPLYQQLSDHEFLAVHWTVKEYVSALEAVRDAARVVLDSELNQYDGEDLPPLHFMWPLKEALAVFEEDEESK